ncbi:hypothetical protein N9242_00790 [Vicingaceae bacterium]|nr:hypothetical protein [Vicingaceae bacterium]
MKLLSKPFYITLLILGVILAGCPYEGDVEISTYEEASKVDKKLYDLWVSFNEEGGKQELLITKLEKAVLKVNHKVFNKKNQLESSEKYRVYSCTVGDYEIFNIEKEDGKYLYCKYGWTGKNEIYVQYINGKFMENNFKTDSVTTKGLREFISDNVNKEELYGEKVEFYRKGSLEYEKVRVFMKKSGF